MYTVAMKVFTFRTKRRKYGAGLDGDLLAKLLMEIPSLLGSLAKKPLEAVGDRVGRFISGKGVRLAGTSYQSAGGLRLAGIPSATNKAPTKPRSGGVSYKKN